VLNYLLVSPPPLFPVARSVLFVEEDTQLPHTPIYLKPSPPPASDRYGLVYMGVLRPELEDCYSGVDGDESAGTRSLVHEVEAGLRAELGLGPAPDGVRVALIEAQDAALAVRPQVRSAEAPRTR
jgi:hypothetical protein